MSDIFDDRRRALEDEYFRRKDKESLERLRAALREDARVRGEEWAQLRCPRCGGALTEVHRQGVTIDRCEHCGGVWLDAGEVAHLTHDDRRNWLEQLLDTFSRP